MKATNPYHMPICIGIGIRISIGKILSSVLGIESIGKKWYRSTFNCVIPTVKLQQSHILYALQCIALLLSFITEALEHILLLYEQ